MLHLLPEALAGPPVLPGQGLVVVGVAPTQWFHCAGRLLLRPAQQGQGVGAQQAVLGVDGVRRWLLLHSQTLLGPGQQPPAHEGARRVLGVLRGTVVPHGGQGSQIVGRGGENAQRPEAALQVGAQPFVTQGQAGLDAALPLLAPFQPQDVQDRFALQPAQQPGQVGGAPVAQQGAQFQGQG